MPRQKLSDKVKKNLLDNDYNRYTQYFNTSIIILFTYFVGVAIAFITKQIYYNNFKQIGALAVVSIALISVVTLLMIRFKWHLKKISEEIKLLKIE